ncbi:FAD/NAD(P)-binding domain-containing protein, partial [Rhizodiscina lignyota]
GLCAAVALSLKGHKVTVLEQGESTSEGSAGIQSSPNFTKLLYSWGLESGLEKYGAKPLFMEQRRWEDSSEIAKVPINASDAMEKLYGYPHYNIHRADLQRILLNRARQFGVFITAGTRVVGFEPAVSAMGQDTIVLNSGRRICADVIIAADSNRSGMKGLVLSDEIESWFIRDSVYRALLPGTLLEDPELESLDLKENTTGWLGPDGHVIGYYVRNFQMYNIVMVISDDNQLGQEARRGYPGDLEKMYNAFEGWDWRLRRMLDFVDSSHIWRLQDRPAAKRWVHPDGNLVLLGDAAHAKLPYAAAGAASAAEDAAALAECLGYVGGGKDRSVREVLKIYEEIRVPRATEVVERSRRNRIVFHMHDGKVNNNGWLSQRAHIKAGREQRERDARLKADAD